jgi:hypothetical protein
LNRPEFREKLSFGSHVKPLPLGVDDARLPDLSDPELGNRAHDFNHGVLVVDTLVLVSWIHTMHFWTPSFSSALMMHTPHHLPAIP